MKLQKAMRNKEKICVYIPTASFFVGGGEIVPLMQAKYLSGYSDISVITMNVISQTKYFEDFKSLNHQITFIGVDLPEGLDIPTSTNLDHEMGHKLYLGLTREVNSILYKNSYKYVICHYAPSVFCVPKTSISVLVLHGVPSENQIQNDISIKVADKVIAVSEYIADEWTARHNPKNQIEVVQNGIDSQYFSPDLSIAKEIDVFFVGRLIKIKGVQYLLHAIKEIRKERDITVVIGGTGPYETELKNMCDKLDLNKIVKFLGYIPEKDLLSYYRRSKVCVFPSYDREGVLTTLLEASSTGSAVITSKCCGMLDFIKEGYNGLFCTPKDSHDLAQKIEGLLDNENTRDILGRSARKSILEGWTWEKSIKRFMEVLEK